MNVTRELEGNAPGHVVVTGGASGIGAATAKLLATQGARVTILDLLEADNADAATAAWWDSLDPAARGRWRSIDLAKHAELGEAVDEVCADGVDALVNCAGVSLKEPFLESTDDAWHRTLAVNVTATAVTMRNAGRMMARAGSGAIVNLASTAAFGHVTGLGAHYHASKGAIVALTKAAAAELGPHGVRVNAVAPGVVRTPMTARVREAQGEEALARRAPLGRISEPADIAHAISYLLSPAAAMVSGHVLTVDGGQRAAVARTDAGFQPAPMSAAAASK